MARVARKNAGSRQLKRGHKRKRRFRGRLRRVCVAGITRMMPIVVKDSGAESAAASSRAEANAATEDRGSAALQMPTEPVNVRPRGAGAVADDDNRRESGSTTNFSSDSDATRQPFELNTPRQGNFTFVVLHQSSFSFLCGALTFGRNANWAEFATPAVTPQTVTTPTGNIFSRKSSQGIVTGPRSCTFCSRTFISQHALDIHLSRNMV